MKKTFIYSIFLMLTVFGLNSCQDKDFEVADMILAGIDDASISGALQGDDYVITWPALGAGQSMQVNRYVGSTLNSSDVVSGTSYVHKTVDTNIEYTYVLKVTDGQNLSKGSIVRYKREGANQISGLSMMQLDKAEGYDALVEWEKANDAEQILLTATNGERTIQETLPGSATSFTIPNVLSGEKWDVQVIAVNSKGTSLKVTTSLNIGKTMIGFLSAYSTPEELIANGDDDEASAWLWLNSEYPTAKYVYFGNIKSAADLDDFRVLFWLRDIETGNEADIWNFPETVNNATPFVADWYKNGGSLLLWSHATPYIGALGRLDMDMLKGNDHAFGCGPGGWNPDTWQMAVGLNPGSKFKKDFSSHPIYKGLETVDNGRVKLIPFKGAGWTEDHNCAYFNLPSVLTGIGNQEESCYAQATNTYGIYPLGVWDSQIEWVSMLNVWEAQQGNTDFKGTIICIGNGGCEFSLKNADGTPDKSAYPKNNPYQDNVLKLAKNSLEYLKTR